MYRSFSVMAGTMSQPILILIFLLDITTHQQNDIQRCPRRPLCWCLPGFCQCHDIHQSSIQICVGFSVYCCCSVLPCWCYLLPWAVGRCPICLCSSSQLVRIGISDYSKSCLGSLCTCPHNARLRSSVIRRFWYFVLSGSQSSTQGTSRGHSQSSQCQEGPQIRIQHYACGFAGSLRHTICSQCTENSHSYCRSGGCFHWAVLGFRAFREDVRACTYVSMGQRCI